MDAVSGGRPVPATNYTDAHPTIFSVQSQEDRNSRKYGFSDKKTKASGGRAAEFLRGVFEILLGQRL